MITRPAAFLVPHRRVLEGARARLSTCHEIALSEDANLNAQVDALVRIGPNGEVMSVVLTTRGSVPDVALRCFKRTLSALAFDPPGGTGWSIRVALILGAPPAAQRPPLPMQVQAMDAPNVAGPIVLRLVMSAPGPAFRAVRSAMRVFESCASASAPPSDVTIDARLLVSDTGDVARLVASGDSAPIVSCVNKASWPETHGKLSRVDVRVSIAKDGKVSVAP